MTATWIVLVREYLMHRGGIAFYPKRIFSLRKLCGFLGQFDWIFSNRLRFFTKKQQPILIPSVADHY